MVLRPHTTVNTESWGYKLHVFLTYYNICRESNTVGSTTNSQISSNSAVFLAALGSNTSTISNAAVGKLSTKKKSWTSSDVPNSRVCAHFQYQYK